MDNISTFPVMCLGKHLITHHKALSLRCLRLARNRRDRLQSAQLRLALSVLTNDTRVSHHDCANLGLGGRGPRWPGGGVPSKRSAVDGNNCNTVITSLLWRHTGALCGLDESGGAGPRTSCVILLSLTVTVGMTLWTCAVICARA